MVSITKNKKVSNSSKRIYSLEIIANDTVFFNPNKSEMDQVIYLKDKETLNKVVDYISESNKIDGNTNTITFKTFNYEDLLALEEIEDKIDSYVYRLNKIYEHLEKIAKDYKKTY